MIKIDCVSDLHGFRPELPGGDLLIVAGDITAGDTLIQWGEFFKWLKAQKYTKKILVGGNHDNFLASAFPKTQKEAEEITEVKEWLEEIGEETDLNDFEYLCDSGTEFMGHRIYGSPWTKTFPGMNPHCMAFTLDTEDALFNKWELIPHDVDILITHSPPLGILDETTDGRRVGSKGLKGLLIYAFRPKLWVYGHIHEGYGQTIFKEDTTCVNASHVNGRYRPVNPPIRIVL